MFKLCVFICLSLLFCGLLASPTSLRADGTNILSKTLPQYALDNRHPMLQWTPAPSLSPNRGEKQEKFIINLQEVVSVQSNRVGFTWTSGLIESNHPG